MQWLVDDGELGSLLMAQATRAFCRCDPAEQDALVQQAREQAGGFALVADLARAWAQQREGAGQ